MRPQIFIFSFFLLWTACSKTDTSGMIIPPTTVTEADTLSYLALGDSYTIGQSVPSVRRWPVQLADSLTRENMVVESPLIIAQTGWTTRDLQSGIEAANIEGQSFDLVSLLIGVNNQFQGRSLEEYETEFSELLSQAITFADNDPDRVFVVSIPDYAFTPFGANSSNPENIIEEIDIFNTAAKAICEESDIPFFNITPISRGWGPGNNTLIASDNLHPSGEQYRLWVRFFQDEVREMLEGF